MGLCWLRHTKIGYPAWAALPNWVQEPVRVLESCIVLVCLQATQVHSEL